MELQTISPMLILLELLDPAVDRTPTVLVLEKDACEPASDLLGDLVQVHVLTGTGGAFHRELVAVVAVVLQQRPDDQHIDWHPDRAAPV